MHAQQQAVARLFVYVCVIIFAFEAKEVPTEPGYRFEDFARYRLHAQLQM